MAAVGCGCPGCGEGLPMTPVTPRAGGRLSPPPCQVGAAVARGPGCLCVSLGAPGRVLGVGRSRPGRGMRGSQWQGSGGQRGARQAVTRGTGKKGWWSHMQPCACCSRSPLRWPAPPGSRLPAAPGRAASLPSSLRNRPTPPPGSMTASLTPTLHGLCPLASPGPCGDTAPGLQGPPLHIGLGGPAQLRAARGHPGA